MARKTFWRRLAKALLSFLIVVTVLPLAIAVAWQSFQEDRVVP